MNYIELELTRQKKYWALLTASGAPQDSEAEQSANIQGGEAAADDSAKNQAELTQQFLKTLSADRRALAQTALTSRRTPTLLSGENLNGDAGTVRLEAKSSVYGVRHSAGELSECVERDSRRYDGAYPLL